MSHPPRYLGLDIGSKHIGVAVSDELGLTAVPVMTLISKRNPKDDLRSLARLGRRFDCIGIVVGDPLHLSGEVGARAVKTRAFAAELSRMSGLPVHFWDERLTSREAHQILYAAGKSRKDHKLIVDQVAATLILQSFMDSQKGVQRAPVAASLLAEPVPDLEPGPERSEMD